jgi:hypothetical protein
MQLLVEHCERKPGSQEGTRLEGRCRAHGTHPPAQDALERASAAARFAE